MFKGCVYTVVQAANRSLGAVITKFKTLGGLPYTTYSKLYDSLVWPIVEYSSPIWGTKDYASVNKLHNLACRFFLGLGKYTPVAAVRAEMGYIVPEQRLWVSIIRL